MMHRGIFSRFQMTIMRCCLVLSILSLPTYAVVHKGAKRREASIGTNYGPPPKTNYGHPFPVYGPPGPGMKFPPPPPDLHPFPNFPHTEYGVPQQLPHREYGIPALKYGPPKLNLEYGAPLFKNFPQKTGGGFGQSLHMGKSSFYDQIKSHFGVPKPTYGTPIFNQHLNGFGGPLMYGPPGPLYGPPPKFPPQKFGPLPGPIPPPRATYGPPQPFHGAPQQSYGAPQQSYGPPTLPSAPPEIPAPAPSGPPPLPPPPAPPAPTYGSAVPSEDHHSGSSVQQNLHSNLEVRQVESNYLPPPSPPSSSYGTPVVGAGSGIHQTIVPLPDKPDHYHHGHGHEHSNNIVSCDGWKPIPGPSGHFAGSHYSGNHASASSDYNLQTLSAPYNIGDHSSGVGGLTDDQLIAIALQSSDDSYKNFGTSGAADVHSSHNVRNVQTQSVQTSHQVEDSYSKPPPDSYAPNSIHAHKYSGGGGGDFTSTAGLVPPSGVYGVPPGGSYQSSGSQQSSGKFSTNSFNLQYGAITGNLKPWSNGGAPPKKPIFFRPPVPQGFLESIGASVQHLDQYGVKPQNEPPTYIPPPPAEIPQHLDEQNLSSHASEHVSYTQAAPSIQEPRFNQAQDCGHGPNLIDAQYSQALPADYDISASQLTGYSNSDLESSGQFAIPSGPEGNDLTSEYLSSAVSGGDSYGPPPSGNSEDTFGYESKRSLSSSSVSQSTQDTANHVSGELTKEELSEFDKLNKVQQSHSVTIPVQGQLGSYQLQFQSANGPAQPGEEAANHEQILSQGLLQSIISAIEQPNVGQNDQPEESPLNHNEVNKFFNSLEGKQVLGGNK